MGKIKTSGRQLDARSLPLSGDKSIKAVAKRLRYIRSQFKPNTFATAAQIAETTPTEWRAWESGKSLIPKRNAWFIAVRSYAEVVGATEEYPSEWIYTGNWTDYTIPNQLPKIGNDLSGFAARINEAIASHNLTLADIQKAGKYFRFVTADQIQAYAAGLDEPDIDALKSLVAIFEIDAAWFYSATPTKAATVKRPQPRRYKPRFANDNTIAEGPHNIERYVANAISAAGLRAADIKKLFGGTLPTRDIAEMTAVALLCGVPLEQLLLSSNDLAIMRRRLARFSKEFSTPARKRRESAA